MLSSLEKLFEQFSKLTGLDPYLTNLILFIIALLIALISIINALIKVVKYLRKIFRQIIVDRDLFPFFTRSDIIHATKYYIETRYQNISPTEDDEPGGRYIASAKDKLLPLFLEKVFRYGSNDNKYYLILADSGMGKTTFLINLYLRYKTKKWKNISLRKFQIRLIPIWHPKAFQYIEEVPDKENTILLLDAFDEMIEAQQNHFKALKKILDKTDSFRIIVLTCRSQFFPSKEEEPNETGYFTAGESGEYHFQKVYLSVFDDRDVKKYLKKKYPFFWHRKKRKTGARICNKSANLIIRPMLLNYIDDIIKDEQQFNFSFQIYHSLINSWMKRESHKRSIKEKYKNDFRFYRALKEFSIKLVLNMYQNRINRNGYFIPRDEEFGFDMLTIEDVAESEGGNIILSELDAKSKSLLNRNSVGDYKFSHKSVLEYYLADALFKGDLDYETFDFSGMDMCRKFLDEMIVNKLTQLNGTFNLVMEKQYLPKEYNLSLLQINWVNNVREITLRGSLSFNTSFFDFFKKLEKLNLFDTMDFREIYKIYWAIFCFYDLIISQVNKQSIPKNKKPEFNEFINKINTLGCKYISSHMRLMTFERVTEVVKTRGIENMNFPTKNIKTYIDSLDKSEIDKLIDIDVYFKTTHYLTNKVPSCKISY